MQSDHPSTAAGNVSKRSLLAFLIVGGGATALQYCLTLLFVYGAGMRVVTASAGGYALSALANYWLNAKLTFRSRTAHRIALSRFAVMASMGFVLNYVFLAALLAVGLSAPVAQVLTTIGVITWNYLISAFWTFRPETR